MSPEDLELTLKNAGLVAGDEVRLSPLTGGVSSEIYLVESGSSRFVVKSALPKLRVKDEWFADIARNGVEQDYFNYAAKIVPHSVPRVLVANRASGWFAMEYIAGDLANWKTLLLAGRVDPAHARLAGDVLGRLHRASWNDPVARETFATDRNFHALRVDPYLLTTARRVPAVKNRIERVADLLIHTRLALVHGDFSPKNLLVNETRLVALDAEVGWFGDPAFDAAFLLTHLFLKALVSPVELGALLDLVSHFRISYTHALGEHATSALEQRTGSLLLCLLLARVHGKSPVEYLDANQRNLVSAFAAERLAASALSLDELSRDWRAQLNSR